jgi:hypothetical protein
MQKFTGADTVTIPGIGMRHYVALSSAFQKISFSVV